ncbi:peptidase [Rhizobium rhizosphaerae]|uniref:Peptidase n=1 Tax=Xaviernesmea rhizosphaerae TaxID=1672749 RepID=A0A1Q9AEQ3_9HYPH|nr:imelysin family protein [Xaviernesmea rhizosphaerae]OLP53438.1 peptidase [Xaviernesmea rhizosphaerae]OQP85361.1 peptidase [Xaviernesmea rhizosphaerae]
MLFFRRTVLALSATVSLLAVAPASAADPAAVVRHYAEVGHAKYADALKGAEALQKAVDAFLAAPSEKTLAAAREAWLAARNPYMETEVYRFGNKIVDDWEGKVNSWPLDEGLIDYVDPSYGTESDENPLFTANVIANKSITIGGKTVDTSKITPELLSESLQEAGGIEANVATGYHAIEFLLWGQDLNGTGPGAGNRPYTDYDLKACTHENCDRRAAYLKAATDLLVSDLKEMTENWAPKGEAAKTVEADPKEGLTAILTGMGSLSYGELAGERMKLGLLLHDPEEEQDCFSDNTHNSHLHDAIGIRSAYTGIYKTLDGKTLTGPSLHDLVAAKDPALDKEMSEKLDASVKAMEAIAERARTTEHYDQMIAEGNKEGNALIQAAVDALVSQAKTVERIIAALDLGTVKLEGSKSLDDPNAVFK